jgi:hypothetical protein
MNKPNPDLFLKNFKYAPYPKIFLINTFIVLQLLIVPILETTDIGSPLFQAWLISGLIVFPFVIAWIYIARNILVRRYQNRIPLNLLLINGWLLGFCKGVATQYLSNLLHIGDSFPLDEMIIRGFSGSSLGLILSFALSLSASSSEGLLASKGIVQENERVAQQIIDLDLEIEALKKMTKEDLIKRVLEKFRAEVDLSLLSSDPERNWKKISNILQVEATSFLRYQSHELGSLKYINKSGTNYGLEFLKNTVLHIHPVVFALIQLSIGLTILYEDGNDRNISMQILANFIITLVLASIAKRVHNSFSTSNSLRNHLTVFVLVSLNVISQLIISDPLGLNLEPIYVFLVFFWQSLLIYSISFISELLDFRSRKYSELISVQEDLTDKRRVLENYHLRLRNEFSKHLHGYLVGKVLRTSSQLDEMGRTGNFSEFSQTLEDLLSEFSLEKFHDGLSKDRMSADFYNLTAESWAGFIDVKFFGDLDFFRKMHTVQRIEMAEVMEELIANAHRHGGADEISINISWLSRDTIEILARDNGSGFVKGSTQGLGFSLFESASDGHFQVNRGSESESTIALHITLYEQASGVLTKEEESATALPIAGHTP